LGRGTACSGRLHCFHLFLLVGCLVRAKILKSPPTLSAI
jgi:hypothetical protein